MAAVNIDAKLVQCYGGYMGEQSSDGTVVDDMVGLSNGCACCSAGDDFFSALAQLVKHAHFSSKKASDRQAE